MCCDTVASNPILLTEENILTDLGSRLSHAVCRKYDASGRWVICDKIDQPIVLSELDPTKRHSDLFESAIRGTLYSMIAVDGMEIEDARNTPRFRNLVENNGESFFFSDITSH